MLSDGVILLLGNTHNSRKTQELLRKLKWENWNHPYSPDSVPNFGSKHLLLSEARFLPSESDVKTVVENWLNGQDRRSVLIDWNDFGVSSAVRAGRLNAIESGVTAIISDLLTVCVAKSERAVTVITSDLLSICVLYESYCTCASCFPEFVNKPSFSIILRVGLFPPYSHRTIFVTI
ncbi:hypothetical protein AVEN_30581-1 [Araneus ventricosus]|uniref:Uncharacterized protein n=1 Tax=Araneus ventricosus TaxID=182803 RepID=A0A4Y2EQY7_ARAVE|nr:hypothetical protein AVEN_30581-1 [Araneus ventricosus]